MSNIFQLEEVGEGENEVFSIYQPYLIPYFL
jgi:hypothetical protein